MTLSPSASVATILPISVWFSFAINEFDESMLGASFRSFKLTVTICVTVSLLPSSNPLTLKEYEDLVSKSPGFFKYNKPDEFILNK